MTAKNIFIRAGGFPLIRLNWQSNICLWLFISQILFLATNCHGGVDFFQEKNLLWVKDYPAEFPCTLPLLARADQILGLGKVNYDEATQTCRIDCSLWIGKNDGSDTYLQIGSPSRPNETLIVNGDVRVYPVWLSGENAGTWRNAKGKGAINCLSLGNPDDPSVKAKLLIDNSSRSGHTIIVGGTSGNISTNFGGQLIVHNGLIAPFGNIPIGAGKPERPVWMGGKDRLELVNATVSDVAGCFGKCLSSGIFINSRFEKCGSAINGGYQKSITGCTFSQCGIAVVAPPRNPLVLRECVFEGNKLNWSIQYRSLVAIDCIYDSVEKSKIVPVNKKYNPYFVSKRHLVVKVIDGNGKPVKDAKVEFIPVQPLASPGFDVLSALTGKKGETPGRDQPKALMLSQTLVKPVVEESTKKITHYSYKLKVETLTATKVIDAFKPGKSWETVIVPMEQTQAIKRIQPVDSESVKMKH